MTSILLVATSQERDKFAGADSRFVRVCDFCAGLIAPEMRYTPLPHGVLQAYFHPGQLQFITTSTYRRARTGNPKSDLREGNAEMLLSLRGISMTV